MTELGILFLKPVGDSTLLKAEFVGLSQLVPPLMLPLNSRVFMRPNPYYAESSASFIQAKAADTASSSVLRMRRPVCATA